MMFKKLLLFAVVCFVIGAAVMINGTVFQFEHIAQITAPIFTLGGTLWVAALAALFWSDK